MVSTVNIYKNDIINISMDKINNVLYVNVTRRSSYDEKLFNDAIESFRSTWVYLYDNNLKCHLQVTVNNKDTNKESVLPITDIIKFISILTGLSSIFDKCLHSTCLTINDDSWKESINLILQLYKPNRPFKISSDQNEINKFFHCNKIVEK
mgnify:CR=1 FL=1